MSNERIIRIFAGSFIIISQALAHYHHPNWSYLTIFVGVNLLQSAFTGFCPLNNMINGVRGDKKSNNAC
jgi:hypothetical protein